MSGSLETRLRDALPDRALAERLPLLLDPFVARRCGDAAAAALDGPQLRGLARALASNVEAARYLAHRPQLLERIASAGPDALRLRAPQLAAAVRDLPPDLESALDGLRLLRRDETLLAAVLELGGLVPFEEVSAFLSQLAEAILGESLVRAGRSLAGAEAARSLAVVGMGKIGGREFTYHSDLDVIFLCEGGVEAVALASRVAQRLIAYLTTRTGAGVAYAVDSRLRPSGSQGVLVTTLDSFARYQCDDAQTWEHLALMRARVIAGDVDSAAPALAGVHEAIQQRRYAAWSEVAEMRRKVEIQRAQEDRGRIAFKTGSGGLMDVDFLAAGAMLERGAETARPAFPGNSALLRATVSGPRVERLLDAYWRLRGVEAIGRWVSGRAVDTLEPQSESHPLIAALIAPGEPVEALAARVNDSRREIRAAFDGVVQMGSIAALRRPA